MECVKGLYVDGVDKHTLAIPLDEVTRGCANMWRRLQDLLTLALTLPLTLTLTCRIYSP